MKIAMKVLVFSPEWACFRHNQFENRLLQLNGIRLYHISNNCHSYSRFAAPFRDPDKIAQRVNKLQKTHGLFKTVVLVTELNNLSSSPQQDWNHYDYYMRLHVSILSSAKLVLVPICKNRIESFSYISYINVLSMLIESFKIELTLLYDVDFMEHDSTSEIVATECYNTLVTRQKELSALLPWHGNCISQDDMRVLLEHPFNYYQNLRISDIARLKPSSASSSSSSSPSSLPFTVEWNEMK